MIWFVLLFCFKSKLKEIEKTMEITTEMEVKLERTLQFENWKLNAEHEITIGHFHYVFKLHAYFAH